MIRAIDSHCHLNFKSFNSDWDDVIVQSLKSGTQMIVVSTNYQSSLKAIEIAKKYSGVWATVGLHPEEVNKKNWREELLAISKLITKPEVIAVGEIGYDLKDIPQNEIEDNLSLQDRVFEFQAKEAIKYNKPVIVHNRETIDHFIKIITNKNYSSLTGVNHCFTGTQNQADSLLNRGFMIGFTGLITLNNQWDKIIAKIPLEKILIETDAPFLAPKNKKGERNVPVNVIEVAKKISEIKCENLESICQTTAINTQKLFNLK